MKVRSPAWIIVAGVVLVQASGAISTVGSALIGIDNAIRATVDLRSIVTKMAAPPKFTPIKQVVIPPVKKMPTKSPVKK